MPREHRAGIKLVIVLCVLRDLCVNTNQPEKLKQLFYIENSGNWNGQKVLSLRLGEKHGSLAVTNRSGSELFQLVYCSTEGWDEKELSELLTANSFLKDDFFEVLISYDLPQSILVPSNNFNPDDAAMLLHHSGKNTGRAHVITELVAEWQLSNIYAVPKELHEWLGRQFPSARYWHQYSIGIKNINAAGSPGCLAVDFRTDEFTLIGIQHNKLLIAQTFSYSTPEDVLYYLLKTCHEFSLSQQETELLVSGLIDKQSALYKELYQYFIHLSFRDAQWKQKGEEPLHFFTSLNDLSRCAS